MLYVLKEAKKTYEPLFLLQLALVTAWWFGLGSLCRWKHCRTLHLGWVSLTL